MAQSITTTCGPRSRASRIASAPSPASPTTVIFFSSSSRRRIPLRTSAWSSTSRTEILAAFFIQPLPRYPQPYKRSAAGRRGKLNSAAQEFRPLAHPNQPDAALSVRRPNADAVVLDVHFQRFLEEAQADQCCLRPGVTRHVVESLLHHTVNVNAGTARHWIRVPGLLVGDAHPGLAFHGGNVPVQ